MASAGLPRGQRAIDFFPRFGIPAYAERWPSVPDRPSLTIGGLVGAPFTLVLSELAILPRAEMTADFHCVTTWTRTGLRWGGYRLTDVLEKLVLPRSRPQARARYLSFTSLDGYRMCIDRRDVHADMLLADRLDGAPLSIEHGAPVRLVLPLCMATRTRSTSVPSTFWPTSNAAGPSARRSPILAAVSRMRSGADFCPASSIAMSIAP